MAGRTTTLPPVLADRQAGRQPKPVSQKCWADDTSGKGFECSALADPRSPLGLCRRHDEEIRGEGSA